MHVTGRDHEDEYEPPKWLYGKGADRVAWAIVAFALIYIFSQIVRAMLNG